MFGYLAFPSTLSTHCTKFQPRARICIFHGYPVGIKGYRLYDVSTKEIFVSRDVVFHESTFSFSSMPAHDSTSDIFSELVLPILRGANVTSTNSDHFLSHVATIPTTFPSHSNYEPHLQLIPVFQSLYQLSPNLPQILQIPLPHVVPHAPSQSPDIFKTIIVVWLMQRVLLVTHHLTYFFSLFHMISCLLIIATLHSWYPWPMSHNSTIKK